MQKRKSCNTIYILIGFVLGFALLTPAAVPAARAQTDLAGVIDFHAHSGPDSVARSIDAIDLAKLAKARGMRGLVLKNHWESTAALAYVVRQEVPGLEVFGGIDLNLSVGGLNTAAIERMVLMKGGYGKVVWMPTFDNENAVRAEKSNRPFVAVSKDGHLLPAAIAVIDLVAKDHLTLETGHSSATDGLLIVHEAHKRGVQHIVVTHAMATPVLMTIPQMKEAAADGAYIEFVNNATRSVPSYLSYSDYAKAIRAIGPRYCILASDSGSIGAPLHPDAIAMFIEAMRKEGFSQADIALMTKTNPAHALGLQ